MMTSLSVMLLRALTAARDAYAAATTLAARVLGQGAYWVERVNDGAARTVWVRPPWPLTAVGGLRRPQTDGDLVRVSYVDGDAFKTIITRAADPLVAITDDRPDPAVLLVILNGVNVTSTVLPLLPALTAAHGLRVRDVVSCAVAAGALRTPKLLDLACSDAPLELVLYDRDMGEHAFRGADALVELRP